LSRENFTFFENTFLVGDKGGTLKPDGCKRASVSVESLYGRNSTLTVEWSVEQKMVSLIKTDIKVHSTP